MFKLDLVPALICFEYVKNRGPSILRKNNGHKRRHPSQRKELIVTVFVITKVWTRNEIFVIIFKISSCLLIQGPGVACNCVRSVLKLLAFFTHASLIWKKFKGTYSEYDVSNTNFSRMYSYYNVTRDIPKYFERS